MRHLVAGSLVMAFLLAGAGRLAAQDVRAHAAMKADTRHAVIGTLERVDPSAETLVIVPVGESKASREFRYTGATAVHQFLEGANVERLGSETGAVVVIRYREGRDIPLAESIWYVGEGPLFEAEGALLRLDESKKQFALRAKDSQETVFRFSPRTPFYGASGLMAFAELPWAEHPKVTVYYTQEGDTRFARFVRLGERVTS